MASQPAIILSGASGVLGTALVSALGRSFPGMPVFCLLRTRTAFEKLRNSLGESPSALIYVECDLSSDISTHQALSAIGYSEHAIGIHAAADVSWDKTTAELMNINVTGSLRFYQLLKSCASYPRMIYISTAYADSQQAFRNGYEESKYLAQCCLTKQASTDNIPLSLFSCSLVVGDSRSGAISGYNGIYPLLRFLTRFTPPFMVGDAQVALDLVPVDWVIQQLLVLFNEQLAGEAPREVIAAAGAENKITFLQLLRLAESRLNAYYRTHNISQIEETPIISLRRWNFLRRSLTTWKPEQLSLRDFRAFEKILSIYGVYFTSDYVRHPLGISTQSPHPDTYIDNIISYWIHDHHDELLNHANKDSQ
ncbi:MULTISPECIES: SDR family oxidoreductase [Pantoea]|uniref:SDR family oxidoreductase n=1 Tax=Pantoea TaxID=53335 RepID=UPI000F02FE85|nr:MULTISPECIES: SDR family oxidoreductase [Pantoea]AYP23487.1 NAD-dependent epimerase/dehydratase family protein [Pantoea agglomerans]TSH84460.1 NAD-dependent epimerase/dehydratase family protein [Pantoea sp. paga]